MRRRPEYAVRRSDARSGDGHIPYGVSNRYLSEIYSGCRVVLFENEYGITELHYSNLHLGNLEYGFDDPYRPGPGVVRHQERPKHPRPGKTRKKSKRG